MKRFNLSASVILLSLLCACESYYQPEEEVICLPLSMSATEIQGTETKNLTADFTYIPGLDLLDHIRWSNKQSHFFNYDEFGTLQSVIYMKADVGVQEEMWFVYNGSLVERIDLVKRNLDYYMEPVDSVFLGYTEFAYEGNDVISESRYEFTQEGMQEEFTWKVEYSYDQKGNILSCRAFDPRSESLKSVDMTYDTSKHPFSGLQYYFNGESFVNNLLSKTLVEEGFSYNYEVVLNEYGYPETILEKLGANHTRTISYSYFIP